MYLSDESFTGRFIVASGESASGQGGEAARTTSIPRQRHRLLVPHMACREAEVGAVSMI